MIIDYNLNCANYASNIINNKFSGVRNCCGGTDDGVKKEEVKMKLRELRERSGFTQKAFAERVGIPVRTYQNYEQGHRDIYKADINTLLRICDVAGCDLAEFITDEECIAIYKKITS